jgi:hypothetical protein
MPTFKKLYFISSKYGINGEVTNVNKVIFNGTEYDRLTSQTTTITLTWNETNHSYELSGGDENITISTDKKSYIYNGTNYTPTFTYTYKLHSFSIPSGPTVVTDQPGSELTGTPDATTNYTLCASRNYYSSSSSYTSESKSVSCNNSTGSVSGDTAFFNYSVGSSTNTTTASKSVSCNNSTGSVSGDTSFFSYVVGSSTNTTTASKSVSCSSSTGTVSGNTSFFSYVVGSSTNTTTASKSVSCSSSTGTVSGDTAFFNYSITSSTVINHDYQWDNNIQWPMLITANNKSYTLIFQNQTDYSAYAVFSSSRGGSITLSLDVDKTTGNVRGSGLAYGPNYGVLDYGTTSTVYSFSTVSPKSSVSSGGHSWYLSSGTGSSATFAYDTTTYSFSSVSPKSSVFSDGYSWYLSSGTGSSATFAYDTTTYSFSSVSPKSSVSSGGHSWYLSSGTGSSATFAYDTTTYSFSSVSPKSSVSSGGHY